MQSTATEESPTDPGLNNAPSTSSSPPRIKKEPRNLLCRVKTEVLKSALTRVSSAVAKRAPASPILTHVFMETVPPRGEGEAGKLVLMATDSSLAIECIVPVDAVNAGRTAVPAKRLIQLVKTIKSESIQIRAGPNGSGLELATQRAAYSLAGENATDFPPMPTFDNSVKLAFPAQELREALTRARYAAAQDDAMMLLAGVHLQVSKAEARFVATDGRRVAFSSVPAQVDSSFEGKYTIGLKAVDEIRSVLLSAAPPAKKSRAKKPAEPGPLAAKKPAEPEEELLSTNVILELMPNQIAATLDNGAYACVVASQLMVGQFPDMSPLIAKKPEVQLIVDRNALTEAVEQAEVFAKPPGAGKVVGPVRFALSSEALTLSAGNADVGDVQVKVDVKYDGPALTLSFNPSLFLDGINFVRREKDIKLGLSMEGGGLVVFCDEQGSYILVGMRPPTD